MADAWRDERLAYPWWNKTVEVVLLVSVINEVSRRVGNRFEGDTVDARSVKVDELANSFRWNQ